MRIGLIGYGQMGREIEKIARSQNLDIAFIIDENNSAEIPLRLKDNVDVAIEFTRPGSAFDNLLACFGAGVPVVCGTTGWLDRFAEIAERCQQMDGGLFYASNFSIGVNLFFELNARLARIMKPYPDYHVRLEEIHHLRKKDAPSGTALTLAGQIIEENPRLTGWTPDLIPADNLFTINSIREGNVTGIHSVHYLSDTDKITIRHEAFNRTGFAIGAVAAAKYMAGRKGIHSMKDLLHSIPA